MRTENEFFEERYVSPDTVKVISPSSDMFREKLHSCLVTVYCEVLSFLFPQIIVFPIPSISQIEERLTFHKNNLSQFVDFFKTTKQIKRYERNDNTNVEGSDSIISQSFPCDKSRMILTVESVPEDKFQESLQQKLENVVNSQAIVSIYDPYLLFVVHDGKPLNKKKDIYLPLSLKVQNKMNFFTEYQHQYQMVAVLYRNCEDDEDVVCRYIGRSKRIEMNKWSTFAIKVADIVPQSNHTTLQIIEPMEQQFPMIWKWKNPSKRRATIDYEAFESVWVRGVRRSDLDPLMIYAGTRITAKELREVQDAEGWLECDAVQCLMHMLLDHYQQPNMLYMNSQTFAHMIFQNDDYQWFQGLERWSEGLYVGGQSLFDDDNVVHVTVNKYKHWYYGLIVMRAKTILVFDSLKPKPERLLVRQFIGETLLLFLKDEYRRHYHNELPDGWIIKCDSKVPTQTGTNDCGIYVILYALQVVRSSTPLERFQWIRKNFSKTDLPYFRNLLKDVLLLKKTFKDIMFLC